MVASLKTSGSGAQVEGAIAGADQEGMDMINAAAAGAHKFGRVKRNGYDPAEVDAVVSRLVEELRAYETKLARMEKRLEEADASADAIRRTFLAAESTRNEIIEDAESEAERLVAAARSEADDVISNARTQSAEITANAEAEAQATAELATKLEQEIAHQRDELLTEAQQVANDVMAKAENEAAERLAAAAERSEEIVTDAEAEAEQALRAAATEAQALTTAANRIHVEAVDEAEALLDAANEEASGIRQSAAEDRDRMRERVVALRAAVVGLEESARHLAAITSEEASVIDLSEIEAMDEVVPQPEPTVASFARMDPEEEATELEQDRPLLTVAEATAELEQEDAEFEDAESQDEADEAEVETETEDPGPATYYQRSTGTPLSERVKIARKSG